MWSHAMLYGSFNWAPEVERNRGWLEPLYSLSLPSQQPKRIRNASAKAHTQTLCAHANKVGRNPRTNSKARPALPAAAFRAPTHSSPVACCGPSRPALMPQLKHTSMTHRMWHAGLAENTASAKRTGLNKFQDQQLLRRRNPTSHRLQEAWPMTHRMLLDQQSWTPTEKCAVRQPECLAGPLLGRWDCRQGPLQRWYP